MSKELRIYSSSISLGCDPELFFAEKKEDKRFKYGKKFIESSEIIPEQIIKYSGGNITNDGVQVELNPFASVCRQTLANNIKRGLEELKEIAYENNVSIERSRLIKLSKKQLEEMTPRAKEFGCNPSKNIHDEKAKIKVDPKKYLYRSGGGHIHLGFDKKYQDNKVLVPLLDILVGNTCVLLDRDEGNIERRKVFGKAGEYRNTKQGLEYRTLSNFWLKNYVLTSFVFGVARLAINIGINSNNQFREGLLYRNPNRKFNNVAEKLTETSDLEDVIKAINTNDYKLALKNFEKIEKTLSRTSLTHPLTNKTWIRNLKEIAKRGVQEVFDDFPEDDWEKTALSSKGWESFMRHYSRHMRKK